MSLVMKELMEASAKMEKICTGKNSNSDQLLHTVFVDLSFSTSRSQVINTRA